MAGQTVTTFFNEIYEDTYGKTRRYVTAKCGNTNDIADILQEIYTEVYAVLVKKGTDYIRNREAFVMQITKTKVYSHYTLAGRFKNILPLFIKGGDDDEISVTDLELSDIELENSVTNKIVTESIWKKLSEKPDDIKKIFYLYYSLDLTIAEIAKDLKLTQSAVKNKLFRTVKELRAFYRKEGE